jgi:outer membrane protein assembly factor BamB
MKMLSAGRCVLILTVGLSVLSAAAKSLAANDDSHWLVSPELLKHANLRLTWQNQLPLKKGETLERLCLRDNYIYALSDKNFLACLDRQKGSMIFGRSIAPAGFVVLGLDLYKDDIIAIIGNNIVELDSRLGTERRARPLEFAVTCPAARNSSFFYLAAVDRRLHALHADNRVQVFEVAAKNDSMITSIIADDKFVIFGTDAGNVIGVAPDKPYQLWQFNAADAIAGSLKRDGMSLFFASKDTNLYRLDMVDMLTTKLAWKQQMPGLLQKEPRVTAAAVYQPVLSRVEGYAGGEGLTAVDKQSGKYMWSLKEGADLLAEAAGKAYIITNRKTLAVMDNSNAKKLYVVNFADVSKHAANTTDSKIYIADERGRVACLEPSEQ